MLHEIIVKAGNAGGIGIETEIGNIGTVYKYVGHYGSSLLCLIEGIHIGASKDAYLSSSHIISHDGSIRALLNDICDVKEGIFMSGGIIVTGHEKYDGILG